jgi:hypothetical protein
VFRLLLLASLGAMAAAIFVDAAPRPGVALGSDLMHRVIMFFVVPEIADQREMLKRLNAHDEMLDQLRERITAVEER